MVCHWNFVMSMGSGGALRVQVEHYVRELGSVMLLELDEDEGPALGEGGRRGVFGLVPPGVQTQAGRLRHVLTLNPGQVDL
jgi:hypothetical protein